VGRYILLLLVVAVLIIIIVRHTRGGRKDKRID